MTDATYTVIEFEGPRLPDAYKNMIYSKWLRSLRYGNDYFRIIRSDAYYEAYQRLVKTLTASPDAIIRLAVLSDDHDVVLGWSCIRRAHILDYVHVQRDQRNQGIANSLVPIKDITTITHLTNTAASIWGSKYSKDISFNPFI